MSLSCRDLFGGLIGLLSRGVAVYYGIAGVP